MSGAMRPIPWTAPWTRTSRRCAPSCAPWRRTPTPSRPIAAWATACRPERPAMKIGLRIFLGYFLIVGLAGFFVMRVFVEEVKPGVRQAMEDTLIDTSNVLSRLATRDLRDGNIGSGEFARGVDR